MPTDDRPKILAAVRAQLNALMATCQNQPRENVLATAKLTVPGGPPVPCARDGRGRPGLARLLDEFFARPDVKADVEELQFDETSDVFSVGNFLICSSDPDINPSVEEQAEQVRTLFAEPRER